MSNMGDWHFEIWEDGERRPNAEILTIGDGDEGWGLSGPTLDEIKVAFAKRNGLQARIGKALAVIHATPQEWAAPALDEAIEEIREILEDNDE